MSDNSYKKIIFTGPVGVGKTTAIQSISDIDMVCTDETATDNTTEAKSQTTVAMDYGLINLEGGERVHLYGTPGQARFDFMWEILTAGGLGLVLLLDNTAEDPLKDLAFYTSAFAEFIEQSQLVVGITRMDLKQKPTVNDFRAQLESLSVRAPLLEIDPRRREDVTILVQSLLYSLDPKAPAK